MNLRRCKSVFKSMRILKYADGESIAVIQIESRYKIILKEILNMR